MGKKERKRRKKERMRQERLRQQQLLGGHSERSLLSEPTQGTTTRTSLPSSKQITPEASDSTPLDSSKEVATSSVPQDDVESLPVMAQHEQVKKEAEHKSESEAQQSVMQSIETLNEKGARGKKTSGLSDSFEFTSRRRPLEKIDFVFPKASNGIVMPYKFGEREQSEAIISGATSAPDESARSRNKQSKEESLEDILSSKKKIKDGLSFNKGGPRKDEEASAAESSAEKKTSSFVQVQLLSEEGSTASSTGRLSRLSVEQALQDELGCRPRANSTDAELNLPQRGLCDERKVLQFYKWSLSQSFCSSTPRGFNNLGNTCFLNSTLQCLLYLPPFSQSLISMTELESSNSPVGNGKPNHGKRITQTVRNLFHQVILGGMGTGTGHRHQQQQLGQAIAPRAIVKALPNLGSYGSQKGYKFRPGRQEDAHEFLVHLLDAMNDGELREAGINQHTSGWRDRLPVPRLDETTFVHRIFGGYFRSQVKCVNCGHHSNTYDPFLNLSLEVSGKNCHSLSDAISEFTRKETLDMKNRWKCSGCQKKVCATKQLTVFRPPLALCMQLKRFTFSGFVRGIGGGHGGKKITKPIDFPSQFSLPLSDGRSCAYSLTGLVIHVGGSASSGHYTAYVKRPSKGKDQWFGVDDSFVEAVSERTVLQQKNAYLLFYCRQEVKLEFPTPPLRSSMSAEEAKELSLNRARARAESIDRRAIPGQSKSIESPLEAQQTASKTTDSSNGSKQSATCALPLKTSSECSSTLFPIASTSSPSYSSDPGNGRAPSSTEEPAPPIPLIASEPIASGDVNPLEKGKQNHDSDGDSDDDSSSTTVASSKGRGSEGDVKNNKTTSEKDGDSSTSASSGSSSSNPSHSASTSSASNSDGSSEVKETRTKPTKRKPQKEMQAPHEGNEPPVKRKKANEEDKKQLPQPKESMQAPAVKRESAATAKAVDYSQTKTRIVVDRGAGRGKVEVMLGPRYKSKVWKPKSSTAEKVDGYGLLGDRHVAQWDDERVERPSEDACGERTQSTSSVSAIKSLQGKKREELERTEATKEQERKRKMFVDRWDAHIDQGKLKTVKSKAVAGMDDSISRRDQFQKLQEQHVKQGLGAISYLSNEQRRYETKPEGNTKDSHKKHKKRARKAPSGDEAHRPMAKTKK